MQTVQTDRQTDGEKQTDIQLYRDGEKQTDIQIYRDGEEQTDKQIYRDGEEQTDKQIKRRRGTDRQHIDIQRQRETEYFLLPAHIAIEIYRYKYKH